MGVDKSGMNGTANHQFHGSLSFDHQDGVEIYLKVPYSVREKAEWSGLSGSSVVRNDGKLLGMLINVSEADNLIRLMSANAILDQIRQQQRLNASGVDQTQPCIVVGSAVTMDDVRNNSAINDIINTLHGKNTHKR